MATLKQASYLRSLMIDRGLIHAGYGSFRFRAEAKHLPHGPTMRERSGKFEAWADRLTPKQASDVISHLTR